MPPIPYNDTAVVDQPWDGPGAEAKLSNDAGAATYSKEYAWVTTTGADSKSQYKFPHHEVASDGTPGAANVNGVRAALSRLGQAATQIPNADEAGVKAHLQKHLDKFNAGKKSEDESDPVLAMGRVVETQGRVWAIRPEMLETLSRIHGTVVSEEQFERMAASTRGSLVRVDVNQGGVATIPLKGTLMPQGGLLSMLLGLGSGLEQFRAALQSALGNADVSTIVLDIDSPGGLIDQIPEVGAEIAAASEVKPVVAVANTLAASAAYWLAAQADEVVVTPSGEVGSIGVYQIHKDISEALAAQGVKPTIISAGKYKVEGNPFQALSEEAQQSWAEGVNDYYNMFVDAVASGRGATTDEVRNGYGEGRALTAKRAVRAGLADRVDTLQATVKRVQSKSSSVHRNRAEGENEPIAALDYTADDRDRLLMTLAGLR